MCGGSSVESSVAGESPETSSDWLPSDEAIVSVTTSPDPAAAKLVIQARRGPVWRIRAIGELGDMPMLSAMEEVDAENRAALLRGDPVVQWQVSPPQAFSYLNADGYGELTQVGSSGSLLGWVVNAYGEVVADPDFDNTQVVEVKPVPENGMTTLVDGGGKQAMVSNAVVTLKDGVPLLTYKPQTDRSHDYSDANWKACRRERSTGVGRTHWCRHRAERWGQCDLRSRDRIEQ